jgi:putative transposase
MPFTQHYCHLVWTTKYRNPIIDDELASVIKHKIQSTSNEQRAILHALGIMPDHIHLAVSIPPRIAISDYIGLVKGKSSHHINQSGAFQHLGHFAWQAEYGLLSFEEHSLASVVAYVNNQAEYHANNTLWPTFERVERDREDVR